MKTYYQRLPLGSALWLLLVGLVGAATVPGRCTIPREAQTPTLTRDGVKSYPRASRGQCERLLAKYMQEKQTSPGEYTARKQELEKTIREDAKAKHYPDCVYSPLCSKKVEVAQHWEIQTLSPDGEPLSCWNMQPVRWVTCEKTHDCDLPKEDDESTSAQFVCRPWLVRRKVLMCCDTPDNQIREMEIQVPERCDMWAYNCPR